MQVRLGKNDGKNWVQGIRFGWMQKVLVHNKNDACKDDKPNMFS